MDLTRRAFSQALALAAAAPAISTAETLNAVVTHARPATALKLEPFNYSGVRLLDGMFLRQFRTTRDRYFGIPNDSLLYGFRKRAGRPAPGKSLGGWYGADICNPFGQFLGGMARMAKATDDEPLREKVLFLTKAWGECIAPDGYSFYSRKPQTEHYIYEKMVGGLNDVYEYLGAGDALEYLSRITDWAIKNLDRSRVKMPPAEAAATGQEWYTLSENLYRAYLLTGDPKYKSFAEVWHYDQYWKPYAEGDPKPYHLHAYSHVNTLSSAAMTYRVSGDPVYLKTIVNAYDFLQRTQCYATGGYGPGEQIQPPDGSLGASLEYRPDTFETPCGSWAGFKLSRYLMNFTGEARYGDWIERLSYNGIGAAIPVTAEGSTFYYSNYIVSGGSKVFHDESYYGAQKWPCCSGTFPEAVADYHNVIYFKDAEGLYVNLYVPSEVTWSRPSGDVVIRQETRFPDAETTALTVTLGQATTFPLHFRVPGWAKDGWNLTINGAPQAVAARPGEWATIVRTWNQNDRVEVQIPMRFTTNPIDSQHPKRVAVTRGPVVWVKQGLAPLPTDFSQWKEVPGQPAEYEVPGPGRNRFVPFYRIGYHEPYVMYYDVDS